jgi:hypothetical protein
MMPKAEKGLKKARKKGRFQGLGASETGQALSI